MKTPLLLAAASLSLSVAAFGCAHHCDHGAAQAKQPCHHAQGAEHKKDCPCPECAHEHAGAASHLKTVTVAELVGLQAEKKVTVVDANDAETRAKFGVIPGAVLLSGSDYDAAKELPAQKDTALVFYCASAKCGASHHAAEKAAAAGYTNVAVFPDGIKGWSEAGKPTDKPKG